MIKENVLKRRCQKTLYTIYNNYLDEDEQIKFDEIKEMDPYLNQIIEEVMHYVIYDLPLQPYILEAIRGDKHANS